MRLLSILSALILVLFSTSALADDNDIRKLRKFPKRKKGPRGRPLRYPHFLVDFNILLDASINYLVTGATVHEFHRMRNLTLGTFDKLTRNTRMDPYAKLNWDIEFSCPLRDNAPFREMWILACARHDFLIKQLDLIGRPLPIINRGMMVNYPDKRSLKVEKRVPNAMWTAVNRSFYNDLVELCDLNQDNWAITREQGGKCRLAAHVFYDALNTFRYGSYEWIWDDFAVVASRMMRKALKIVEEAEEERKEHDTHGLGDVLTAHMVWDVMDEAGDRIYKDYEFEAREPAAIEYYIRDILKPKDKAEKEKSDRVWKLLSDKKEAGGT